MSINKESYELILHILHRSFRLPYQPYGVHRLEQTVPGRKTDNKMGFRIRVHCNANTTKLSDVQKRDWVRHGDVIRINDQHIYSFSSPALTQFLTARQDNYNLLMHNISSLIGKVSGEMATATTQFKRTKC